MPLESFTQEGFRKWRHENGGANVRKSLVTLGAFLGLLFMLFNPSIEEAKRRTQAILTAEIHAYGQGKSQGQAAQIQKAGIANGKPSPVTPNTATPDAGVLASQRTGPQLEPLVVPPAVDPWAAWFGLFEGVVNVPERGQCTLDLLIAPMEGNAGQYSGESELTCIDTLDVFRHARKAAPLAPGLTLNPTRATFKGSPQDGTLVFQATVNSIEPGTYKACEMVSVTVRPFVQGAALLGTWKEKQNESGVCAGGELKLVKKG